MLLLCFSTASRFGARDAEGILCAGCPEAEDPSALLQRHQSHRSVQGTLQKLSSGATSRVYAGPGATMRLAAIGLGALLALVLMVAALQLCGASSGEAVNAQTVPPVTPRESSPREQFQGTCLVIGSAMIFAVVAVVVKKNQLPVLVATECRFLVNWFVASCFMAAYKTSRGLRWFGPPELRKWLVLKCVVHFLFTTLWWAAIQAAPVGDAIAIIYCNPVLTALLATSLLREALPRTFGFQAFLALGGTVLIVDPPFLRKLLEHQTQSAVPPDSAVSADYTLLTGALVFCAIVPIVTRKCLDCSWIEVEHVHACLACTVLGPCALAGQYVVHGALPELPKVALSEVALIVLGSLGCFVGIAMETKGFQLAEAGKAAMFRYIEVPWAYVLQHFFTSEPLELRAVIGATTILGSCLVQVVEAAYL